MRSIQKMLFSALVAGLLLVAESPFARPVVMDNPGSKSCDNGQCAVVHEIPKGPIDGSNTVFSLSQIPVEASALRLYRNGLRLTYPTDYQITTNTITVSSNEVPQAGDELYATYVGINANMRSRGLSQTAPQRAHHLNEISVAEVRNALRNEIDSLSTFEGMSPSGRAPHKFHRLKKNDQESLELLAAQIGSDKPDAAQGVEGLGDGSVPSVYSAYGVNTTNNPVSSLDREEQRSGPREYRQAVGANHDMRSGSATNMLEDRLENERSQQSMLPDARSYSRESEPSYSGGNRSTQNVTAPSLSSLRRSSEDSIAVLETRINDNQHADVSR